MAGEILKKRREDLNLTVKEIADHLKIRRDYLDAIEKDAFDKLPVAVYTKGYIRAYAEYLRIEAQPIIDFYSSHLAYPPPSTIFPISSSKKKGSRLVSFFLLLTVVAASLAAYIYITRSDPGKTAGIVAGLRQAGPDSSVMTPASIPVQTATPSMKEAAVLRDHDLNIFASELTWILIRFSDGNAEEATLRPGDTVNWRFSDRATLRVGNAGGIKIVLDDKTLASVGSRGQVTTVVLPPGQN